ncbi:MAG: NfeD family protein [Pseudomonadota bacterium]
MPWWGWIVIGFFLLGSELVLVDVAFYLVFIGLAAIVTGLVQLAGIGLDPWAQWLMFGLLSIVFMVFFRKRLYEKLRATDAEYRSGLAGDWIRIDQALASGSSNRQEYRGSMWTVTNRGANDIAAGTEVRIDATEGLTIIVGED